MSYLLMNKDEVLLKFRIIEESGYQFAEEIKVYSKPFWVDSLTDFLNNRKAPLHREHIAELLKQCQCETLIGYLNFTHALSLNDTLWVKDEDEKDLEWKCVSLYRNEFDETISKIAFTGGMYGEQFSSLTPELGTNGQFAKCWIRDNDNIYLIKRGSEGASNSGLEPYSEYYGSKILNRICDDVVIYDLVKYRGKLATKCGLFTSEDYGFVPMMYLNPGKSMPTLIKYIKELGFYEKFCDMIVGDTVIMNEDRHLGNFGVIVSNKTFDIVDFAPLFDHNLSMLCYADKHDLEDVSKYLMKMNKGHKLDNDTFINSGIKFLNSRNRQKLRSLLGYGIEKHEKYNLEDWRLDILNKQVNRQIESLLT